MIGDKPMSLRIKELRENLKYEEILEYNKVK